MSNLPEPQENPDLIFAEDGQPFNGKKELTAEMNKRGITNFTVIDVGNKYAAYVESYWWVKFQAKSSKNDTNDVELAVNGDTIIVKRGERVCLPNRFLECADHATYPQFEQLPGKPRKIVAYIQIYPYERISKTTEAEYRKMLSEGTKTTKEAITKYGSDYDPERLGA
jgi:hypothetical protein